MRGRIPVVAALAAVVTVAGAAAQASSARRAPARLLVSGVEYRIQLSRAAVKRGPALIQFLNRGQDPHDLKLRRLGASPAGTVSFPELRPGALVQVGTRLRPGRYRLWCSLPGHDQRGMHAVLTVRSR